MRCWFDCNRCARCVLESAKTRNYANAANLGHFSESAATTPAAWRDVGKYRSLNTSNRFEAAIKLVFEGTATLRPVLATGALSELMHISCTQSGRTTLPLIVGRICRYDCGDKQWVVKEGEKERVVDRGEAFSQLPWAANRGHVPSSNTTIPLNTFGSAYCFSFTRLPLFRPSFAIVPFHSAIYLSLSFFSAPFYSPFFSCCARSGIDRCHKKTNTPGRTCQRVLMSPVIVISTLIRTTVRTSEAFATACAILNIIRLTRY